MRTGSAARRRALQRSEVYFPYFSIEGGFEAENTRAALAPHGIEPPPLRAYFDRLMAFARAADWGRRPLARHEAAAAIDVPQPEPAMSVQRRRRRAVLSPRPARR
jgi:hypothetical protein